MANSNFIQESIFKAVDVILEKRLKNIQANYCILGIINSDNFEVDDLGEKYYLVNYQDMIIKAYPVTPGTTTNAEVLPTYKKGDLVYTLVVNGDLSKKRIILCKA